MADEQPHALTAPQARAVRTGRPPKWTPEQLEELQAELCARVSEGETVRAVARQLGVSPAQVHRWTEADEGFRDAYARARVSQAHAIAEEALELADATPRQLNGGPGDAAIVAAVRLQVDTRKWMASKLAPRIYGEQLNVQQQGAVTVRVVRDDVEPAHGAVTGATTATGDVPEADWQLVPDTPDSQPHAAPALSPSAAGYITSGMSSPATDGGAAYGVDASSPLPGRSHLGDVLGALELLAGLEAQLAAAGVAIDRAQLVALQDAVRRDADRKRAGLEP